MRALAVLVVATPCPLILAAPIALASGVSRAARAGIVVKGGGAIERLGRARTVLLDKTGTLTLGAPAVERVSRPTATEPEELLRLAASVDELSAHVVAEALVHDAEARGLVLAEAARRARAARRRHRGRGRGPSGGRRIARLPARARVALDGEASRRCARRGARRSTLPSTDGWRASS